MTDLIHKIHEADEAANSAMLAIEDACPHADEATRAVLLNVHRVLEICHRRLLRAFRLASPKGARAAAPARRKGGHDDTVV